MNLVENMPAISLLPPIITIILVLLTKRVILSLWAGILSAAVIITTQIGEGLLIILENIILIITDFTWYMPILLFLVVIGILSEFIKKNGGTIAFAKAISKKIKTKRKAANMGFLTGIIIFFDDYFSIQVLPQITKDIADEKRLSHAKLAYINDSLGPLVASLSLISTWSVMIIGAIAGVGDILGLTTSQVYLTIILMSFYMVIGIIILLISINTNFDFKTMKRFEKEAEDLKDSSRLENKSLEINSLKGTVKSLMIPIILFITIAFIIAILTRNSVVGLFIGALIGTIYSIIESKVKGVTFKEIIKISKSGFFEMWPAVKILFSAWMLANMINIAGTGEFIGFILETNSEYIPIILIPVILLLISAGLAFATGTSWGTIAIMFPIVIATFGSVDSVTVQMLLIPTLAATLSGAVMGDHTSIISDTTILSAATTKTKIEDHFTSQMPYGLLGLGVSAIGFIVMPFMVYNGSSLLISVVTSYIIMFISLYIFIKIYNFKNNKKI